MVNLAPLFAGRGRIALAIGVKGNAVRSLISTAFAGSAPHPDPLPVKNGERERCAVPRT
jgi:hypothetical protein